MIPTLFGVTVVSFVIMQLAPGDPLLSQLGPGGGVGESSQTREAYLLQKRDLKLDKPLVLNFNYFKDFTRPLEIVAHYRGLPVDQIEQEMARLATGGLDEEQAARLAFLQSLKIPEFNERLFAPDLTPQQLEASGLTQAQWKQRRAGQLASLARAVDGYLLTWCEDLGKHGVPPGVKLLSMPDASTQLKIGVIRSLAVMVVEPFVYTYSRNPSDDETSEVISTWRVWWDRNQDQYPQIDPDRRSVLQQQLKEMAQGSREELFERLESYDRNDTRFFAETLLGEATLEERVVAATFLRLYHPTPLSVSVPLDADAERVDEVAQNWQAYFEIHREEYFPSLPQKLWYVVADTQYSHMVWRLATFNFGRSALKTREPVSTKIWNAVIVSAPLMLMAQLVIYLVAVPLGIVCAVNRGNWVDRAISLMLYLLYSIPPFVAAMLFLLYLAYGDYLRIFPMERLHSEGAERTDMLHYLLDYLWHCVLPVVCLSLFSLAGLAMYARTSMLDVIGQDYIRTARAKGVSERKVVFKHALRNSLIPVLTLFSNFLPAMLGGSVLIEFLFNIPGMGRLSWASIEQKDFPTLMALIYIDAIVVLLSILMTDLLYVLVDPRIGFQGQGK